MNNFRPARINAAQARPEPWRSVAAHAVALGAVSLAFLVTSLSWPALRLTPWAFFCAAVMLAAWHGGPGPGLLALGLATVVGNYAFIEPYGSFGSDRPALIATATFVAVSLFISYLAGARRRSESREREGRRWFAATLASIGDAVLATDTAGRVTFMNDIAEQLTGWSAEEAAGHVFEEVFLILNEETREPTPSPVKRALETGHVVGFANHTVLVAKDGRETCIEDSASPIKDDLGEVRGVILVFRDAGEKRWAELAEEEARRQTTNVLESITDAYVAIGPDWRFTYANEMAERLTRMKRDELLGKDQWELFPATLGTPVEVGYRRAMEGREPTEWENFYEPWGIWISCKASPARDGGIIVYFRDITEAKRAEETTTRLAAIVESSDDIIVSKTLDGIITSWNRGAERILGYTAEEVIGRHISTLMPPEVREDAERILGRIRRGEKVDHYETKRIRKDGTVIDISVTVSPLRDSEGRIIGASKVGRDVTREKLIEAERIEADRRKDEFLAMLAHELRNPLSAIGNAVSLSNRSGLQEHIDWSMGVIARQMKHLTRLIDDLLDVSRISRGKIDLRRDVLDLYPILESALATTRPLIEERKHAVELATDRENLWVNGDATRIEQVMTNLLNNAAKYSENGGHIRLSAYSEGDQVVISVIDRGMGIPPEKLPQMFELFAQGDRSLARSEGGLGIGLTVVKKLVELHGGSVTARSHGPGTGCEFTFRLPRAERPSSARPEERSPRSGEGKSARILVVDDNEDTARGMARLLKLLGHQVALALDGYEAIRVAGEHRPDFVLLDIGLPGMDGYEVASRLRREECCQEAVIIAVSGYGQDEDRRRSKEAGFDHHLVKPVDHDALISLLLL